MGRIEEKLKEMGLALPTPPAKGGCMRRPNVLGTTWFTFRAAVLYRRYTHYRKAGEAVTEEQGYLYARNSMLNVLAVLKREIGDLDRVKAR